jgi:predicted transcriptional regulator
MEPRPQPDLRRRRRIIFGSVLGGLLLWTLLGRGADTTPKAPRDEVTIMVRYLQALPSSVQWPTNTFATPEQSWRVGVLGPDRFEDKLEAALRNEKAGRRGETQRGFEIWHAQTLKDLPPCQIIFIALKDPDEIKNVLAELKDRPVLTVSEQDRFLYLGGIIEFSTQNRNVRMAINLDQARAANLKIPADMLEVTSEVIENGSRHKTKH